MRTTRTSLAIACGALLIGAGPLAAQKTPSSSDGTVTETFVEDSFFNQCTGETVDRSYTKRVVNKRDGRSYSLEMTWEDGKGVGQKTGDRYRLNWDYKQIYQASPDPNSEKGIYTLHIVTSVDNLRAGKDYDSETLVSVNYAADGSIAHKEEKRTGIVCS